jgi:filamentous hemagglutinin family protein
LFLKLSEVPAVGLVSLVMTVFNRERYLGAAIESILSQTYEAFELVVWDDGSTDRSLQIAQKYAQEDFRVRVMASPHVGRVPALQAAIAQTSGIYLGWIDSDDLLDPQALAETVPVLDAHPETGMVYTDYCNINETGKVTSYGHRCRIPYSRERLLLDFMTFHFRLVRRSVFDQVGGIDGSLNYVEDYDLCLRLSEITSVRRIRKPLYYYRHHATNASQQWRLEQALRTRTVVQKALKRRGLAEHFELDVQFPTGRLLLRRRFPKGSTESGQGLKPLVLASASPLLVALPLASLMHVSPVQAQSIMPARDGTNTFVTPRGNTFDIEGGTQAGANLFHSFQQFGLSQGQIANFLANPSVQNILGRVTGGEASVINGLIRVTGGSANLYLMNPAGIVFGPNASLNVPASFTATTATGIGFERQGTRNGEREWFNAIGNNRFADLVGDPTAVAFGLNQPGAIVNAGNLAVGAGQSIALLGGVVVNTGQVSAPGGLVTIAAVPGQNLIRLTQPGSLLSFEIQPIGNGQESPASSYSLTPPSLAQLLTGGNLGSATGVTVNPDGTIRLVGTNQNVPINPGTTLVSGTLDASGTQAGVVHILGNRIGVLAANIGALGNTGGGTVLIGGGYRGQGMVPNAASTFVDRDSVITANSLLDGAGGQVVVWADQTTRFFGRISARGGANSGDGGLVEVSGKQDLVYQGQVDTRAIAGRSGLLLLDPENITIVANGYGSNDTALPDIFSTDFPGQSITLTQGALEGFGYGNVILEATNNITINPLTNGTLTFNGPASVTFRADADGNGVGNFSMNPGNTIIASGIPLTISGANLTLGNLQTSNGRTSGAGSVTLSASGNVVTGNIDASSVTGLGYGAGNVDISSTGGTIATGTISTRSDSQAGSVELSAPASDGNVSFSSIDASGTTGGTVSITAGRFVQGTGFVNGPGTPTINSRGSNTSGPITIQHGGGALETPFVVGDASTNGTAGTITNGTTSNPNLLSPTQSFPSTFVQGDIQIITSSPPASNPPPIPMDDENPPPLNLEQQEDLAEDLTQTQDDELPNEIPQIETAELDGSSSEVAQLEETVTDEFEAYLDLPDEVPKFTPEAATDILDQIGSETGIKPALVYASFVPTSVAAARPNLTQAKSFTQALHQQAQVLKEPLANDDDQLELLVVTAKGQPIRRLVAGANRGQVLKTIQRFLTEITDPRKVRTTSYLPQAQQLYRWLVAPIEADLKARNIGNLAYISDTGLRFIPLAALHDGKQFLVEKFSVGLMPSLSLTDTRYVTLKNAAVLAMGASEFADLPPLPAVPTELSLITRDLGKGMPFLNQAFTLENLKEQRQQKPFQIIHLATHSEFQSGALSNSFIQLWDTRLRLDQVRQLGWSNPPVELLVLSACRTALGSDDAELGFAGFAVQAGVKSALASLWNVSDQGTLAMMTEFYRQLQSAPIKAEALRRTQIAMLKGQVTIEGGQLRGSRGSELVLPATLAVGGKLPLSHPYYWAAFTLIGSPW